MPRRICRGPAHRRLRACVILGRGPTSGVSVCPRVWPGNAHCLLLQRYQDMPGVEHIPVVQIDLSVPLKVPGKYGHRRREPWEPMSEGVGARVWVPDAAEGQPYQPRTRPLLHPWLE